MAPKFIACHTPTPLAIKEPSDDDVDYRGE